MHHLTDEPACSYRIFLAPLKMLGLIKNTLKLACFQFRKQVYHKTPLGTFEESSLSSLFWSSSADLLDPL